MAEKSSFIAGDGKSSSRPRVGKMKLFINGKKYWIHPHFNLYAGNKYGEVIHISKFVPMKGNDHYSGYLKVMVRGSEDRKQTTVYAHRFIYECYHGVIPEGMVIDHINDNKKDNRLCNLQLMTQQQIAKKLRKIVTIHFLLTLKIERESKPLISKPMRLAITTAHMLQNKISVSIVPLSTAVVKESINQLHQK